MVLVRKLKSTITRLARADTRITRRNARRRAFSALRAIRTWIDHEWPGIEKPERFKEPTRLERLEVCLSRLASRILKTRTGEVGEVTVKFRSLRAVNGRAWWATRRIHLSKTLTQCQGPLRDVFLHEVAHLERKRKRGELRHDDEFQSILAALESDWKDTVGKEIQGAVMWNDDNTQGV